MNKSKSPMFGAGSLLPLAFLLIPQLVQAEDDPAVAGSFGIGIGTDGLGVDYAYHLNRYVDLRAGYDFGSLDRKQKEDGIDYQAKLKFSAARLLVDLKPFGGGFRISTGFYTGSPELNLDADGTDDYDIGDSTYRGDLKVDGDVDLGSAAPYLGIGWGGTAGTTGFGASFDLGVIFTSSPKVGLAAAGMACDATDGDCDPATDGFDVNGSSPEAMAFQSELQEERRKLEDDAKDFNLWPVIRFGLHYRY